MLVISDLHIRPEAPRCRGENDLDWAKHQFDRLAEVAHYAVEHKENVAIAGDIFHRATNPEWVANLFLSAFKPVVKAGQLVYIMMGNHDLKHRNSKDDKVSYDILKNVGEYGGIRLLGYEHHSIVEYGTETIVGRDKGDYLFLHVLTFKTDKDVPYGVTHYETADSLFKKYPNFKYIVVGDQHNPFHVESKGRHVINCGCLTPQSIGEKDYKLGFWHITDANIVQIPYKTAPYIIQTKGVKEEKERNDRISKAMQGLADYDGKTIDFELILLKALTSINDGDSITPMIQQWIEEVHNEQ